VRFARRERERLRMVLGAHAGAPVASIVPPPPLDGRGFAPVALEGAREEQGARVEGAREEQGARAAVPPRISRLLSGFAVALTRVGEQGARLAVQAFAAPRPGRLPLVFVLAIALADVPYPEASELDGHDAQSLELECGPAVRLRAQRTIGAPQPDGEALPVLSVTYLSQTDLGVLALAFVTPHVDGAEEFTVLFDSIARSCRLTGG
jgi:hypothetical protein